MIYYSYFDLKNWTENKQGIKRIIVFIILSMNVETCVYMLCINENTYIYIYMDYYTVW